MVVINMHEAKTYLSTLVQRARKGEEIVIGKSGEPLARLVAYQLPQEKPLYPGDWKGKVWTSPDFDDESEEINKLFYGDDHGTAP